MFIDGNFCEADLNVKRSSCMRRKLLWLWVVSLLLSVLIALPMQSMAESGDNAQQNKLSKEELAQLLAPIALYPDELVSQILMASTYPLEVVKADRWAKSHKQSAGDALAKQLEKEPWDPSVKALVSFPVVLAAMSEKLDVTTKIGDAFLSQQKEVMDTIQVLRKKAYDAGNLKTSKEQKVVVEKEVIIIQSADPQVIYVPTYSPTVVYGTWMYPAYPPYYYYPPPPPAYPPYSFSVGIIVGPSYGYGHCDWHGGYVYPPPPPPPAGARPPGTPPPGTRPPGTPGARPPSASTLPAGGANQKPWQHNPEHRKGVAYKDGATAKKFGQSPTQSVAGRGDAARGYGNSGGSAASRPSAGTMDRAGSNAGNRPSAGATDRGAGSPSAGTMNRGGLDNAFSGGGSGSQARAASDRGMSSRQSAGGSGFSGGGSRGGGGGFSGGGGGSRGGGGGGGGGGRGGGGRR